MIEDNSKAIREKTANVPVPRSVAEWVRKTEFNRTINDMVEDIHLGLIDQNEYNPDGSPLPKSYISYLDAVYDSDAVEGSLATDNTVAAQMIREEASRRNVPKVTGAKLATIVKALNIVLRRYGVSRNDRRNTIGGEIVSAGNGD